MGEITLPTKRVLSTKEAAAYLNISPTSFKEYVAPSLPRVRILKTSVGYLLDDLDDYLNRMTGKKAAPLASGWDKYLGNRSPEIHT